MFNEIFYEKTKKQNASLLYEKLLKTYNYKKSILNESIKSELISYFTKKPINIILFNGSLVPNGFRNYAKEILNSSSTVTKANLPAEVKEALEESIAKRLKNLEDELEPIKNVEEREAKQAEFMNNLEKEINETIKGVTLPKSMTPPTPQLQQITQVAGNIVNIKAAEEVFENAGLPDEKVGKAISELKSLVGRQIHSITVGTAEGSKSVVTKQQLDGIINEALNTATTGVPLEQAESVKGTVLSWLSSFPPYVNYETNYRTTARDIAANTRDLNAVKEAITPGFWSRRAASYRAGPKMFVAKYLAAIGGLIGLTVATVYYLRKKSDLELMKEINAKCKTGTIEDNRKQYCQVAAEILAASNKGDDPTEDIKKLNEIAKDYYSGQTSASTPRAGETPTTGSDIGKVFIIKVEGVEEDVIKVAEPDKYKYYNASTKEGVGTIFSVPKERILREKK